MIVKSYEELDRDPKAGDRVKIKDKPGSMYWSPRMDKWRSSVMTVREIRVGYLKMLEDIKDCSMNATPGWDWYPWMIEGVVIEEPIPEDTSEWFHENMIEALLT